MHTQETKNKISKIKKKQYTEGLEPTRYWKDKSFSKEHINNLKLAIKKRKEKLGYVNSPSKRKAISEGKKGHKVTNKTKQKLRDYYLGKTYEEIYGKEKAKKIKEKLKSKKGKSYEELFGEKASEEKKKRSRTHKKLWENEKYVKDRYKSWKMTPTKPEKIIINLIQQNNLNFIYVGDGKKVVDRFNPDFINEEKKLIIEHFGDYWHNKEEVKKRDKIRFRTYKQHNYKTLVIWQKELENPNNVVKKIREFYSLR